MKRFTLSLLIAPLFAAGCAARQVTESEELIAARQEYARASQSNAAVEAPKALTNARWTLSQAEEAHAVDPGSQRERELAYMAMRRSQAAIAEGNARAARRDEEAAKHDLAVTGAQAAQAAEKARAEAEAAKAQADAANQQAANATQQANAATQQAQLEAQQRAKAEQDAAAAQAERDKAQQDLSAAQAERDKALVEMRRLGEVAEKADKSLVLTIGSEVMFRSRQAALLPRAKEKLDQLAEALLSLGTNQQFVIEGHTDSRGSADYNRRLSRLRALAVRSYLISRGVDPDRIRAEGRGEEEPVASNADAEGRANNRRVEIIVTPPAVSRR